MTAVARIRGDMKRLLEASLLSSGLLLLGLAGAAVPDAALGVAGAEEIRNHLLAGVPGFALLAGWWLVRVSGDPDAAFSPGRFSLLACGVMSQLCGLLALVMASGTGVPGMGVGDAVVTGASLLLLGGGAFTLAATRRSP